MDPTWFSEHDIHVHVPAGAVPKDGPSAGITIATALVSLVRGEPVSSDVAMTGEVTLTGQVLQIGGVRDKVLAAQRTGIHRVILPRENEADLVDLPPEARDEMEFVVVDSMDEVLDAAFDGTVVTHARRPAGTERQAGGYPESLKVTSRSVHASGLSSLASHRQSNWYSVRLLRSKVSRWRSSTPSRS